MRRWRRGQEEDDEALVFDDDGAAEDRSRPRSYARPMRTVFDANDEDDEEEDDTPSFDDLEAKIRAGKYKPKPKDPWNAHILYQALQDLGDI